MLFKIYKNLTKKYNILLMQMGYSEQDLKKAVDAVFNQFDSDNNGTLDTQ
jgi:hypothetical protein